MGVSTDAILAYCITDEDETDWLDVARKLGIELEDEDDASWQIGLKLQERSLDTSDHGSGSWSVGFIHPDDERFCIRAWRGYPKDITELPEPTAAVRSELAAIAKKLGWGAPGWRLMSWWSS